METPRWGDWFTVVSPEGKLLATARRAFRGDWHVKMATGGWAGETFHAKDRESAEELAAIYATVTA